MVEKLAYTIEFGGTTNTNSKTPSNFKNEAVLQDSKQYINSVTTCSNVFVEGSDKIKLSSSKSSGSLEFSLAPGYDVAYSKVIIKASPYSDSENTFTFNGTSCKATNDYEEITVANSKGEKLSSVSLGASKRAFIHSIAVYVEEEKGDENSEITKVDNISLSTTGVTGTTYKDWTATCNSGASYAGNSAGGNSAIQLRSTSNAGIIVTHSPGIVRKVTLKWNKNTSTTSKRAIDVYGSHTAYTATSNLYDSKYQGTKLGSLEYSSGTELTLNDDYEYIGIKSNDGALYLDEISITWELDDNEKDPIVKSDANLKFSSATATATVGETFTNAPTLSKDTDGAITYTSSNTSVATVNQTSGIVTIVAAGTTTITATSAETSKYKAGTASYTLTVNPAQSGPNPEGNYYQITFDNSNSDASTDVTSNTLLDYITTGKDYVASASEISKVYKGTTGLKFGTGSVDGKITLNLSDKGKVKATKIVVNAKIFKDTQVTLSVNGKSQNVGSKDLADYEFNLDGSLLESITLVTTGSTEHRAYVKGLTIYYETSEPGPVLGPIVYSVTGDKKIGDDDAITVDWGDEFTFAAENATNITAEILTDDYEGPVKGGIFENGTFTWKVDQVYEVAFITVTPYLNDTAGDELGFWLYVNNPMPSMPVVTLNGVALQSGEGSKTIAKGTTITIESENAKEVVVELNGKKTTLTEKPYVFEINESGSIKIYGKNGENTGEAFTYDFVVGEVDPNMPALGSNFKQILNNKNGSELTEGYYVIGRHFTDNGKDVKVAMSVNTGITPNTGTPNIKSSQNVTIEPISTGTQDFDLLTVTGEDVLILYLEDKDGQWGLRTVNYGDGFQNSQKYIYAPSENATALELVDEFKPVFIDITTQNNANIYFTATDKSPGRTIKAATNGDYFNYQTSGYAVELFKYTTAKKFDYMFENLMLSVGGDPVTVKVPEEHPEDLNYEVIDNPDLIVVNGDQIIPKEIQSAGEATVEAKWSESPVWFGGSAEFKVSVRVAPEFGFRHAEVRGKKGVGVVAQAVYYNGDGKVTYSVWEFDPDYPDDYTKLIPTNKITINEETGMIRPEDIREAVIGKPYVVKAHVEDTDSFMEGTAYYTLIIEAPEGVVEMESTGTFDFTEHGAYGLFKFNESNSSEDVKDKGKVELYEKDITREKGYDHDPVSVITASNNEYLTITLDGNYRSWESTSKGDHLRLYAGCEMTFSVAQGSIESITFDETCTGLTQINLTEGSAGNYKSGTSGKGGSWTAPADGNVKSVTFVSTSKPEFRTITVKLNVPKSDGKKEVNLYFNDDDRIVNTYAGLDTKLPELFAGEGVTIGFDEIEFDIDEINEKNEDETFQNYEPTYNDFNDLWIKVNDPGVYTFRADFAGNDKYLGGMAILRLNVFPRLDVLPTDNGGNLAEDSRTEYPELTLVHPVENGDGTLTAEIALPSLEQLNDPYKYSTVKVNKVTIKHGEETTVYVLKSEDEASAVDAEEELDMRDMPKTFSFEKDGSVTYSIMYANTDDFKAETTVHVVLMPQVPTNVVDDDGIYKITASQNANLEYYYCLVDPLTGNEKLYESRDARNAKRMAGESLESSTEDIWNNQGESSMATSIPEDVPEGMKYAIRVRSTKDLPVEVTAIDGIDSDPLTSDSDQIILLDADAVVTVGKLDPQEWTSGVITLDDVLAISSDVRASDYVKVSIAPKGFEVNATPDFTTSGLPDWLLAQMKAIEGSNGNEVDGFLTKAPSAALNDDDLSVDVACSGLYTVTFSSDDGNVEFKKAGDTTTTSTMTQDIAIYPNPTMQYNYTLNEREYTNDRLNINGFPTATAESLETDLLYSLTEDGELYDADNITQSLLIIPGVYMEDIYYSTPNLPAAADVDDASGVPSGYVRCDNYKIDLTGLSTTTELPLKLILSKNGATMPDPMVITIKTKVYDPDSVDTIGAEDGEAEYYDLNGFKVNADKLDKGIYIKVQNGKAVKVMI